MTLIKILSRLGNIMNYQQNQQNQQSGGCEYIHPRGALMMKRCDLPTTDKYCHEHQPLFSLDDFIQTLLDNPDIGQELVDVGSFFSTHHQCHDCLEDEYCDNCYSGDTEFEETDKLSRIIKKIFTQMKVQNDNDSDAEEDNDAADDE